MGSLNYNEITKYKEENGMKKKIIATVMIATMTMGLLSGCGNGSDTDSQNVGASGEKMYNVVMQWPSVGDAPSGLEDVEKAVNDITADIGVTVTLQPVGAFDLGTETSLAVSSGDKLDLCLSLYSGVGTMVNNGSIMELSDLLDEYGSDIEDACGIQMAGGNYNNGVYGVPVAYVNGAEQGFICRTDLLDKYGIQIDSQKVYTADELEQVFDTVKQGEGDNFYILAGGFTVGLPFGSLYTVDNCGASLASGGIILDGSDLTQIENVYASDEFSEFADRMYNWNKKGFFSPDASTTTEDASAQISSGNYFGVFVSNAANVTKSSYTNSCGMDMTYIKTLEPVERSEEYQTILWSIPTTCENPEKTMEFLNLVYKNSDLANLLQYGIEGTSYQIVEQDDNGTVIEPVDGQTTATVPYWQNFGIFGNRLKWYAMSPNTTSTNSELEAYNKGVTKRSPALGYVFSMDSVSSQYSAVTSEIAQYSPILMTGSIDPKKELPEFLKALEDAGIDSVINENQNQLDKWMGKN